MSVSHLTAEEWLAFFEQPDVIAMCRTIAAHPHDLTPRYIWLDWLDEYSPDPELPKILRESVERGIPKQIPSLTQSFGIDLFSWRGRLTLQISGVWGLVDRLCCSGVVGTLETSNFRLILHFSKWFLQSASFHQLTAKSWKSLFGNEQLARLTSLALWGNDLGNAGAVALAKSPHIANLTSLDLRRNLIDTEGAEALANSQHLVNLTSLDLRGNNIGDFGAVALANSSHFANLCELYLGSNNIGHLGANALANSPYLSEDIRARFRCG